MTFVTRFSGHTLREFRPVHSRVHVIIQQHFWDQSEFNSYNRKCQRSRSGSITASARFGGDTAGSRSGSSYGACSSRSGRPATRAIFHGSVIGCHAEKRAQDQ